LRLGDTFRRCSSRHDAAAAAFATAQAFDELGNWGARLDSKAHEITLGNHAAVLAAQAAHRRSPNVDSSPRYACGGLASLALFGCWARWLFCCPALGRPENLPSCTRSAAFRFHTLAQRIHQIDDVGARRLLGPFDALALLLFAQKLRDSFRQPFQYARAVTDNSYATDPQRPRPAGLASGSRVEQGMVGIPAVTRRVQEENDHTRSNRLPILDLWLMWLTRHYARKSV
jgi:hypothetical protein